MQENKSECFVLKFMSIDSFLGLNQAKCLPT